MDVTKVLYPDNSIIWQPSGIKTIGKEFLQLLYLSNLKSDSFLLIIHFAISVIFCSSVVK